MSDLNEEFGKALGEFLKFVFSLLFPITFITSCFASLALTLVFHVHQFDGLTNLTLWGLRYAESHPSWMVALIAFVIAALPLAWVAYKEQAIQTSAVIGIWTLTSIVVGFTAWLTTVWPPSHFIYQRPLFAYLLLMCSAGVVETILSTAKLIAMTRQSGLSSATGR